MNPLTDTTKLITIAILIILLTACNPFASDGDWIYAETPIPDTNQPIIVTVGDSIAAGWQDCRTDTDEPACVGIEYDWWSPVLADDGIVLNRGIGGSTSTQLLDNWERDTQGADIVFILIGVNDLTQNSAPETLIENFITMHQQATDAGMVPIFSTVIPSDTIQGAGYDALFVVNSELQRIAEARDWWLIDLYSVLEDSDNIGYLRREEIAYDGSAHPNQAGYDRMTTSLEEWWSQNGTTILNNVNS